MCTAPPAVARQPGSKQPLRSGERVATPAMCCPGDRLQTPLKPFWQGGRIPLWPTTRLALVTLKRSELQSIRLRLAPGKHDWIAKSRLQEPATWRSILLSNGEVPVGTKIAEEGGRRAYAGQQVRILDIPADLGDGVGIFDADGLDGTAGDLADRIKDAANRWYGVAGLAFLGRLLEEGPDDVGGLVNEMIDAFAQANVPAGADGQVRRAARMLGLIGAAGELATTWGILPWREGAALEASAKALKDWIGQRGGFGAAEERDGIEQVRAFLAGYGESRFDPIDDPDVRPANARAGWRRGSGEAREWLILPSVWRDEICRGRDGNLIARALEQRGMLRRDSEGKYQRSERTPLGQRRVYVVNASVLEAGDES